MECGSSSSSSSSEECEREHEIQKSEIEQRTLRKEQSVFYDNIEEQTLNNAFYRKVLWTDKQRRSQVVVMCLAPGEDIPLERHENQQQFIKIEKGLGIFSIGDIEAKALHAGSAFLIPPNVPHYVKNTSKRTPLKLYSVYTPAVHAENLIHERQKDAKE